MPERTADADDPLLTLARWMDEARDAGVVGYDAMTVATVATDRRPSARAVLARRVDTRGVAFYTDTRSRKGRELAANPVAAGVLFWPALERQVRVEGEVEVVGDAEADEYFAHRPRGHQVAAWVSAQSHPLDDRLDLERRLAAMTGRFAGRAVPRPPYWVGYRIVADMVELWEGRPDRLHHRVAYRRRDPSSPWTAQLLWP